MLRVERKKDSKAYRGSQESKRQQTSPEEMISSNRSSGESYWTALRDSPCPMTNGRPFPYMDGQTVKNNLTVDRVAKLEVK